MSGTETPHPTSESRSRCASDRSASDSVVDRSPSESDPTAVMGRTRTGRRGLSRDEVKIAVKRALDRVGANGATKAELVATIGAGKTSLQTVQRALVELRDADAQIECFGRERRWRLVEPFGMPLEAPDREDLEEHLLLRDAIDKALATLPEELRLAVVLRDVQGLDYREIAATLGVPIGTVESRIFRGRQRLRPLLEPLREGR